MADSDAPPGFPQLPAGGDGHIERSRSASAHSPAGDLNVDMFPDDPPELKEARKQYRDHECRECGELGHIRFLCPKMKCFKCGRKGHARQFCPKVKKGPQQEGSTKPLSTASSGASTVVIRDASGNLRIVKEDPSQPATPPSDAPAVFQSAKPRPPPASSKAPASAGGIAAASSAPSSAHCQNGHPESHSKDLPPPFTVSEGTTDAGSPVGRGGSAAEASSRYVPASQPAGSVHMAAPSSSGGHADLPKYAPPHQRSSAEAPEVASTLAACSVQLQNLMRMLLQYGPNMSQVDDVRRLLDSHQQAQVSKGDAAFLNGLKDALVHESGLAHIGTQQYWEAVQVAFESNLRALQTRQHGDQQHHIAAHAEMQQRQPIMSPPSSNSAGPGSSLEQFSQGSSDAHLVNSLPPGSGLGTQAFIPLPNGSLAASGKLR